MHGCSLGIHIMSEKYLTDENGLLLLWADGEPITLHDDELEDDGGQ